MNKKASPEEKHIGRCSIDNTRPFFDAIALSGLSENQVHLRDLSPGGILARSVPFGALNIA